MLNRKYEPAQNITITSQFKCEPCGVLVPCNQENIFYSRCNISKGQHAYANIQPLTANNKINKDNPAAIHSVRYKDKQDMATMTKKKSKKTVTRTKPSKHNSTRCKGNPHIPKHLGNKCLVIKNDKLFPAQSTKKRRNKSTQTHSSNEKALKRIRQSQNTVCTSIQKEIDTYTMLQSILYPAISRETICDECSKCKKCFPKNKLAQDILNDTKLSEDEILKKCISLCQDNNGTKRVAVKLPVNEKLALDVLKGSNYNVVLNEWRNKLRSLSDTMKADISAEFNSLLDKGYIVPLNSLPEDIREEISNNKINFFISAAPAYKDSKSTKAQVAWNCAKLNNLGVSLNQLLPF